MKPLISSALIRGLFLFIINSNSFATTPIAQFAIAEKMVMYSYADSDSHQQTVTQVQTAYTAAGNRILGSTARINRTEIGNFTGTQLATIDNHGHRVSYTHDSLGRLIAIDYGASQETIAYHRDTSGSWQTTHYPDGIRTETIYADALGRKKASYDNARGQQPLEQLTYNDLGQVQQTVDINQVATQYHYDALGQTIKTQTGLAGQVPLLTQITDYDAVTNKTTQYSQASDGSQTAKTIQYRNDSNELVHGVLQGVLPADKTIDSFAQFDNFGQRVNSQDDSHLTAYQHNATGALRTALMGSTNTQAMQVDFTQDLLGDLVTKQLVSTPNTPPLMRYVKRYNSNGQLIAETLLGGKGNAKLAAQPLIKRYHYNTDGNLTRMDDWQLLHDEDRRLSIRYRYTYVLGGKKVSEMQVPSYHGQPGYSVVTKYNPKTGKVTDTYKTSHHGRLHYQHIHYQYDPKTLWLIKKTYNDSDSINYRYNKTNGQLRSVTNPQGYITQLFYDPALGKINQAVIYQPDGQTALAKVVYRYNSLQHLARKYRYRFSADGLTPIPVDTTLYHYDKAGTVTDVAHQFSQANLGNRIERMHYVYNNDGSLAQERYWLGDDSQYRVTRYRYDALKRLVYSNKSEYGDTGFTQRTVTHYQFDVNSNMIGKEVRCFDQLTNGKQENQSHTYYYNGLDQLIASPEQTTAINYDAETGDLLRDEQGRQYTYDALHKLIHLQVGGKSLADYSYGSDGMRASKTGVDDNGLPITLHYFYNGYQLLATRTDEQHNTVHNDAFYFFGLGREARLIVQQGQVSVNFYGDDRHSVSSTLAFDAAGKQTLRYHQADDYGKPLGNASTDTALSINYNPYAKAFAEYSEQETLGELQYRPARELNTVTHQFTTLDTDNDFMNRYGYCEGNPIGKIDPSGNWATCLLANILPGIMDTYLKPKINFLDIAGEGAAIPWSLGFNLIVGAIGLLPEITDGSKANTVLAFSTMAMSVGFGVLAGHTSSLFIKKTEVGLAGAISAKLVSAAAAGGLAYGATGLLDDAIIHQDSGLQGMSTIAAHEKNYLQKMRWMGFGLAALSSFEGGWGKGEDAEAESIAETPPQTPSRVKKDDMLSPATGLNTNDRRLRTVSLGSPPPAKASPSITSSDISPVSSTEPGGRPRSPQEENCDLQPTKLFF